MHTHGRVMFRSRVLLVVAIISVFFSHAVVQGAPNARPEFQQGSLRHSRALKDYDMHMVDITDDLDPELVKVFIAGAIFMVLLLCFLSCCCGCLCGRRERYYENRGGYYYGGGGGPRWTLCDCLALACLWEICCDRRQGYESF